MKSNGFQDTKHYKFTAQIDSDEKHGQILVPRCTTTVAVLLDPKVLKAVRLLDAGRLVRSATFLLREHIRIMLGLVAEKKLVPLFYQKQAVERAMSWIS